MTDRKYSRIVTRFSTELTHPQRNQETALGNLTETFPYDDGIYMLKLTGAQLRKMVKHLLRDDAFLGTTEFYRFSKGENHDCRRSAALDKLKMRADKSTCSYFCVPGTAQHSA